MQTIFADRRQAFYRFAVLLDMPTISEAAWRGYVTNKLQSLGIGITDPALSLLLQKTGGHPYCVMAVAYNAYLHVRMQSSLEVDADVIHFAYDRALDHLESIYDIQWQEIHHLKHADTVLAAIIEGVPPYSVKLSSQAVAKALAYLIRISMITKGERRGDYRLVEPMFGDWYRRNGR